jgi:YVTN family beta-propeller protein
MRKHLFLCVTWGFVLAALASSLAKASSVYVAEWYTDTVAVIDTSTDTVIHHIPVGDGPMGVAANPAETRVYVGLAGPGSVAVIDTATNTIITTVEVAVHPAVSRDGTLTDCMSHGNGITVIDAL